MESEDGDGTEIVHVRCLNHVISITSGHAIKEDVVAEVVGRLPEVIRLLSTLETIEMLSRHCPRMVHTRWIEIWSM
jgi:hypothetical protein